jgi:hypothetical protein
MPASRSMHQTTIRFGSELWSELEAAADAAGTSIAQYVREAAVMRLARGPAHAEPGDRLTRARRISDDVVEGSMALAAESRLATSRARSPRGDSARARHT